MAIKFLNSGIFTGSVTATDGIFNGELLINTNNARLRLQRTEAANYIDFNSGNNLIFRSISATDTGQTVAISLTPAGAAIFASSVSATGGLFSGSVTIGVDNWLQGNSIGTGSPLGLVRSRAMGYPGYYGMQVGIETNHIALFIDPMSVAGGNFSGNVNELMLPNKVIFQQANAAGTDWLNGQSITLENGKVGIGTTSPVSKLEVNGSMKVLGITANIGVAAGMSLSYDPSVAINYINTWNSTPLITSTYNYQAFHISGSEKMRIASDGNVGIGDTGPNVKLQVSTSSPTNNVAALIGDGWVGNSDYHKEGGLLLISGTSQDSTQTGAGIAFQTRNTANTNYWKSSVIMDRDGAMRFTLGGAGTTAGSEDFTILSGGNIGIGTASPVVKLNIVGLSGLPATSGTTQNGGIRIENGVNNGVLDIGASNATGVPGWLQSTNKGDLSAGYNLLLNPNGGNVGIGTTNPATKLQVAGGIQMADDTATAVASKVGTMRYRTGTEYVEVDGTEIIVDGDFSTPASWATETNWSITGGQLVASGATGSQSTYQIPGLVSGKIYRVQFEITAYTSGTIKLGMGTSSTGSFFSGVGVHTAIVTAAGTLQARFMNGTTPVSLTIDNASVIEVTAEDASYADMCMQTGASTYEWVNIVRNTY